MGGFIGIVLGTVLGWFAMNVFGTFVAWAGSPMFGLEGADLTAWTETIAAVFATYQMEAAGFAMIGALFGLGWGRAIGARPDDTSLLGNLIATVGVLAILTGMEVSILQSFITFSNETAFLYLVLVNGLIVLGYGIMYIINEMRDDVVEVPVETPVESEDLIV